MRVCKRNNAGGRCNGWANGRPRILGSPWRWLDMSGTPSRAANRSCRRKTSTTRCFPRNAGPFGCSATKSNGSPTNLKVVLKELVQSPYYRVDGLASAVKDPRRRAELDDVGLVRLLTPEQLERKLTAVFGQKWGRLTHRESKFKILYGGIDSKAVTQRMTDPSGAMGAIQRIMSNDVACKNVALDFSKEPSERLLFPQIELSDVPGDGAEADALIRKAIVHLHQHLLGREHASDHPEVQRTYKLFAGIVGDAKATKGLEKVGSYHCDRVNKKRLDDPHYTLRAWRGVVTYLLRQHDFLYE